MTEVFKRLYFSFITSPTSVHMLNIKKAMLQACQANNLEIVKFLVSQGFQLNQAAVGKKAPLYVACEGGHIELATWLI